MHIKGYGKNIRLFLDTVRTRFKGYKKAAPAEQFHVEIELTIALPLGSGSDVSSMLAATEAAVNKFSAEAMMACSVDVRPIPSNLVDFEAGIEADYNSALKVLVPDKKIVTPAEAASEAKS